MEAIMALQKTAVGLGPEDGVEFNSVTDRFLA